MIKRFEGNATLAAVTSTIGIFSHGMYRDGIPRSDSMRRFDWRRALRMERRFNLFRCREGTSASFSVRVRRL